MLFKNRRRQFGGASHLDPIELFQRCAADRGDSEAWREFLRRYSKKIRHFINGPLSQKPGQEPDRGDAIAASGVQETDLFQNAIMRLVENDCAAMKRFSGRSENDLLAYMAVICRSAVLDALRRANAQKRRPSEMGSEEPVEDTSGSLESIMFEGFEREFLAHELVSIFARSIGSQSSQISHRDQLVFKLHFFDGLSYSQIAQCKGINLSKGGVQKLLKRLVNQVQILASSGKSGETVQ